MDPNTASLENYLLTDLPPYYRTGIDLPKGPESCSLQ